MPGLLSGDDDHDRERGLANQDTRQREHRSGIGVLRGPHFTIFDNPLLPRVDRIRLM